MLTFAELKVKIMNSLSTAESNALQMLHKEHKADFGKEKPIDLTKDPQWEPERTIRAEFIRWLCTDPDKIEELKPHGIHISGVMIEGELNLAALDISLSLSLRQCFIPKPIDFRHTILPSLDLSGSRTARIEADCLIVNGDLRLAEEFRANGPVSLIGANIKGDIACVMGHFDNLSDQEETTKINGCSNCRASTLHAYALVLERARIGGSVNLCGGFTARGGVHLGDSIIGLNLNCTKSKFIARCLEAHQSGKTNGRRLACESDADYHLACAVNGEGMHVKGNLIMNGVMAKGEMRLTGAIIDGDLESSAGKFYNKGANAIHGDRLHVRGNIFFCDGFEARGAVRLPRAEIGADLSFYKGLLTNSKKDCYVLYCEGIHVMGTVYLSKIRTEDGHIEISNSFIGGNLDCTDSTLVNPYGWALKAKGIEIKGSIFLCSSDSGKFRANGLVGLTGSKLGMDLICTNGQFKSDKPCELEGHTPCAIKADNMTIGGKVEMGGGKFKAEGGINLDDTNIGSYLKCDEGTFNAPPLGGNYNCAISAGKLQAGGSIYLRNGFNATGQVILNDSSTGRNFSLTRGTIKSEGGFSLQAMQVKVAGSVNMVNFVSYGEVRIDYASIGGNLNCSKGEFVNNKEKKSGQEPSGGDGNRYAFHANGVKIAGCAEFKDGFHVDGTVSFQLADIGMSFYWMNIKDPTSAALYLDAAKVAVLYDEEGSWPGKDKLQINDFEYRFLKELSPDSIKSRREKWLGLPRHFRTQPYEQLATVLRRSGYEEDAKEVLIEKNSAQRHLPVRWPWAKWLDRRCPPKDGYRQSQCTATWFLRALFGALVCYGYKPSRAIWYGLIFVIVGWGMFSVGFNNNLMVPIKDGGNCIYQIAAISSGQTDGGKNESCDKITKNITQNRGLYSFVYTLDTFMPVIKLQAADYWLPTAHPPEGQKLISLCEWFSFDRGTFGGILCVYRWFLIISGWVLAIFYGAALSGLVRK